MRFHLPALNHGVMGPASAPYLIRINGHLGATMLSAFPALAPQHHGADTVLTGLLDQSALHGVLAQIEALGLDLLELQKLTPDHKLPKNKLPPPTVTATTVGIVRFATRRWRSPAVTSRSGCGCTGSSWHRLD